MKHREQILKLRSEGKTYDEIRDITGASKGTISFHCGKGQKEKSRLRANKRHPFLAKLERFDKRYQQIKESFKLLTTDRRLLDRKIIAFHKSVNGTNIMNFNFQDIVNKFGNNPKCYLTGKTINIYKPRTYHFDHIIPVSKGGDNSLDNLGICTKEANMSKTDHTVEEFIQLCKDVLIHNGYKVDHPDTASGLSDCKSNKDANPS